MLKSILIQTDFQNGIIDFKFKIDFVYSLSLLTLGIAPSFSQGPSKIILNKPLSLLFLSSASICLGMSISFLLDSLHFRLFSLEPRKQRLIHLSKPDTERKGKEGGDMERKMPLWARGSCSGEPLQQFICRRCLLWHENSKWYLNGRTTLPLLV